VHALRDPERASPGHRRGSTVAQWRWGQSAKKMQVLQRPADRLRSSTQRNGRGAAHCCLGMNLQAGESIVAESCGSLRRKREAVLPEQTGAGSDNMRIVQLACITLDFIKGSINAQRRP
jgi:hypothetical protein